MNNLIVPRFESDELHRYMLASTVRITKEMDLSEREQTAYKLGYLQFYLALALHEREERRAWQKRHPILARLFG